MKLIDENLKQIFESQGIDNFMSAYAYLKNTECYTDLECLVNAFNNFEINCNDYDYIRIVEVKDKRCAFQVCKIKEECTKLSEYIIHCAKLMVVHHELFDVVFEIRNVTEADYTFIFKDFAGITQNLTYKQFDDNVQALRQEMYADAVDDLPEPVEDLIHDLPDEEIGDDLPVEVERPRGFANLFDRVESRYDDEIINGPEPELETRVESIISNMRRLIRDTDNYGTGGLRFDVETGEIDLNTWGESDTESTRLDLPSGDSVYLNSSIDLNSYSDFAQFQADEYEYAREYCENLGINIDSLTVNEYRRLRRGY